MAIDDNAMRGYEVLVCSRKDPREGHDIILDTHKLLATEEEVRGHIEAVLAKEAGMPKIWQWDGSAYVSNPEQGQRIIIEYRKTEAKQLDGIVIS